MEGVFYLLLFLSDFLESTSLKRFLKGGHSRRIVFPLLENTPRLDPRVGPLFFFFANVRLESILADDFCLWYDPSVIEGGGEKSISGRQYLRRSGIGCGYYFLRHTVYVDVTWVNKVRIGRINFRHDET